MSRKGEGSNQVVVNVEIHKHGGIESAFGDEFSYGPVCSLIVWELFKLTIIVTGYHRNLLQNQLR